VRRPKAALQRGLQDWMPAAMQDLQGLQDGFQGLQDSAALTALRLLRGVPAACKVTLRQDDGEAFGAEWRVDSEEHAKDSLPRTLVVALAASGRLQQVGLGTRSLRSIRKRRWDFRFGQSQPLCGSRPGKAREEAAPKAIPGNRKLSF